MNSIKEKLDLLHNMIEEVNGIVDFDWCVKLFHPYYEHFNDDNLRYRGGSLIAFWGLLIEWEDRSGFPFYLGKEGYNRHYFDKYLKEFLKHSSNIKKQYPNIYFVIIQTLNYLDKRENFEDTFPNIPSDLFSTVRKKLLEIDVQKISTEIYKNAFREAGMSY
jgi:hypothetical protein